MRIRRLCELRMFRKRINHDRKEKTFRSPARQTQKKKKKSKRLKRVLKAIKSPDPAKRSERRRKMMENSRVSSGG